MASNKQAEECFTEQQQNQLENSMKELLEKILSYMEKFIKTKEDLKEIEEKLNDYDNLNSLLDIIKTIFAHLTTKIDLQISKTDKGGSNTTQNSSSNNNITNSSTGNEDYDQLEKILQKQEAEIRMHIRSNQTMKLYQENLQQKLDESEQARSELLESTKHMINDLKRQNNTLGEQIGKIESENRQLHEKIKQITTNEKVLEEKLLNMPYLEEKIQTLEKMAKDNMQDRYLSGSVSNMLSKENSVKKMEDVRKIKKSEISGGGSGIGSMMMGTMLMSQGHNSSSSTSPLKIERRTPTPNLLSSNKENNIKSTYQRFYNNFKLRGDENKDMRSIPTYTNNPSVSKNGVNQLIQPTVREKELRTLHSQGNSMTNSHNNSFIYTNSSNINNTNININNNSNSSKILKQQSLPQTHQFPQANNSNNVSNSVVVINNNVNTNPNNLMHKRSKSHQINKIKGVVSGVGSNCSNNSSNHAPSQKTITDYSRLSNHDLSDIQQVSSAYNKQ